jgi:hypothetical protein
MATQAELDAVSNAKISQSLVDAKGDLLVGTANDTIARLAAGTNGNILTADSSQTSGLKWTAAPNSSFVNIKDYGATGDGTTDDTTSVQNAINALATGGTVYCPPGSYLVTSVNVNPSVSLAGSEGSIIKLSGSGKVSLEDNSSLLNLVVDGSGTSSLDLVRGVDGSNSIVVDGVHIAAAGITNQQTAFRFYSCDDVTVQNCNIEAGYFGIFFDTCNRSKAINNSIVLSATSTVPSNANGSPGSCIYYWNNSGPATNGFIAVNNYCKGVATYGHGITWWGGDSASVQTYYVNNILIANNYVTSCCGAIWGSNGTRIAITGNVVDTANDTGIDFEGCLDGTANGNTVNNAVNALMVLYGSKRISFVGNTITSDKSSLMGGGNQTDSSSNFVMLRDTCEHILIEGNQFSCTAASKCGEVIVWRNAQTVASKNVKIIGNKFFNGCLQIIELAQHFTIRDNHFHFNYDVPTDFVSVMWIRKSSDVQIDSNVISLDTDTAANTTNNYPVFIDQENVSSAIQIKNVVVTRNVINNMPNLGIYCRSSNGSNPDGGGYRIADNIVAKVNHSGTTATNASVANNIIPITWGNSTVTSF